MVKFAGSLDANVLLRLILRDVPAQHAAAVALLAQSAGKQFAVADIAIIEIVFVLTRQPYEFTRIQVREAVEGLLSLAELNCNRPLFYEAMKLFVVRPALSFEDCCLATYAMLNNAEPLYTFDKKLSSQSPHAKRLQVVSK